MATTVEKLAADWVAPTWSCSGAPGLRWRTISPISRLMPDRVDGVCSLGTPTGLELEVQGRMMTHDTNAAAKSDARVASCASAGGAGHAESRQHTMSTERPARWRARAEHACASRSRRHDIGGTGDGCRPELQKHRGPALAPPGANTVQPLCHEPRDTAAAAPRRGLDVSAPDAGRSRRRRQPAGRIKIKATDGVSAGCESFLDAGQTAYPRIRRSHEALRSSSCTTPLLDGRSLLGVEGCGWSPPSNEIGPGR
jgi:hypothetical protein